MMRGDVDALLRHRVFVVHPSASAASVAERPNASREDIIFSVSYDEDVVALTSVTIPTDNESLIVPLNRVTLPVVLELTGENPDAHRSWVEVFEGLSSPIRLLTQDMARVLWAAVQRLNPEAVRIIQVNLTSSDRPTLHSLLEDPRWKLRQGDRNAIVRAAAAAVRHERALDDVLLFAALLAESRDRKSDTGWFTLKELAGQLNQPITEPVHDFIVELLKLGETRKVTLFDRPPDGAELIATPRSTTPR